MVDKKAKELTSLIELTSELVEAVRLKSKDRAAALIEQIGSAWSRANALQLKISATADYPDRQEVLVSLASALNGAMEAKANALGLTGHLGTPR